MADSLPRLPATMPGARAGEPAPRRDVQVQCRPEAIGTYNGWVEVTSDDPVHGTIREPVTCHALQNQCPVPVVETGTFFVAPLDAVVLDGSPSTDPDGRDGKPTRYRWEVVSAPEGSSSSVVERLSGNPQSPLSGATPDDEMTPHGVFFVDLAGTYTLQLHVVDPLGLDAPSPDCPAPGGTVTILATPPP